MNVNNDIQEEDHNFTMGDEYIFRTGDHICRSTNADKTTMNPYFNMKHGIITQVFPVEVVHFETINNKKSITKTSFEDFMDGYDNVWVLTHKNYKSLDTWEILLNIVHLMISDVHVNVFEVFERNDEYFCVFCKYGKRLTSQPSTTMWTIVDCSRILKIMWYSSSFKDSHIKNLFQRIYLDKLSPLDRYDFECFESLIENDEV